MILAELYMTRCIELAQLGAGSVSPNPMVGCVLVYGKKIIGEGYHREYGGPHAEVNAIETVKDKELLKKCTLYVSLEPCSHQGLTPPCTDLIIRYRIPKVVIGTIDPFAQVAGKGIERLKQSGVAVVSGILEKECRELNRRFFTFHEKKRPYIILKWAQTTDGYIDIDRNNTEVGTPTWITGDTALRLVHKIRSEEDAVLVGTRTALKDNPSLTVRNWYGRNPVRAVIDRNLTLPSSLNLFDGSAETIIFNSLNSDNENNNIRIKIDFSQDVVTQILNILYQQKILSVIVEGGRQLLEGFKAQEMWDEMHVFIGDKMFSGGVRAPLMEGTLKAEERLDKDILKIFRRD